MACGSNIGNRETEITSLIEGLDEHSTRERERESKHRKLY
mgnify:CR=1 FL=1